MHEFSICRNLLQQVQTIASQHKAACVKTIHLQLGPLADVTAADLLQTFPLVSKDTKVNKAELKIDVLPIRSLCMNCGAEYDTDSAKVICGACGSDKVQILSGDEIILKSVELGACPE